MKFVKVSLSQKILFFLINSFFLINILIISKNIFLFEDNLFLFGWYLLNVLIFYYVLKSKLFAIKLYGGLMIFNIFYIYAIYNSIKSGFFSLVFDFHIPFYFIVIVLLFIQFNILNLCILNTNINKGLRNLKTNLKTSKNQAKRFVILNILIIIFLIAFRFLYYDVEKDIENIDKSFFVTKYENIDIQDEDNLYTLLHNFNYDYSDKQEDLLLKIVIVDCLYKDICFPIEYYQSMIDEENKDEKERFKVKSKNIEIKEGVYKKEFLNNFKEEEQIKEVQDFLNTNKQLLYRFKNEENLNKEINNLINIYSKKKFFKVYVNNYYDTYGGDIGSGFIRFNRDLIYKILYYLNNKQESKAIELLGAQIKTSLTILNGDGGMISKLAATSTLRLVFNNLDLILNNFDLTEESKKQLRDILSENTDVLEISGNMYKNMYKSIIESSYFSDYHYYDKTSLHDISYIMKGLREIIFNTIKNKGEVPQDIILKYKDINYLKKNQIGQLVWQTHLISFKSDYNKIEDVIMKKEAILKKLGK